MSDTQLLALAEMEIKDQWERIKRLRADNKVMRVALTKIKNEDYRANHNGSFFIAKTALEKLNEH